MVNILALYSLSLNCKTSINGKTVLLFQALVLLKRSLHLRHSLPKVKEELIRVSART